MIALLKRFRFDVNAVHQQQIIGYKKEWEWTRVDLKDVMWFTLHIGLELIEVGLSSF